MYNIRDIAGDAWICIEEHPVVRLSGTHATAILDTAEKLQQAKSWGHLGWYLAGVVNGANMARLDGAVLNRGWTVPGEGDLTPGGYRVEPA